MLSNGSEPGGLDRFQKSEPCMVDKEYRIHSKGNTHAKIHIKPWTA